MGILLTDSLVSYWPLNEDGSEAAVDAHGSNHLAVSAGDTLPAADGGRLFALADQDYLSIASNASLVMYGTSFTIRCKVKLTSKPDTAMYLVNKYRTTATATREYALFWNNSADRFAFTIGSPSGGTVTPLVADHVSAPSVDVWYNLTIWYDHWDSLMAIQVDDGAPKRASQSTSPMDAASAFFIGALANPSPSLFTDATIKDVGVWKRVLTPAEIQWLNNSGTSRTYAEIQEVGHVENPWQMVDVNGIWTWFNSPEAIAHNDTLWFGSFPNSGQKPKVGEVDLITRAVSNTTIDQVVGQTDDHDNPAIIRLKSGYLLAVFSFHGGDSWAARSTNVDDATAWEAVVSVEESDSVSYAQVMQVDHNDRIYYFARRGSGQGTNRYQGFYTSDDDGATWSGMTPCIQTGTTRPYFRWIKTSGTRLDFFCTTGHPGESVNSLYHGYLLVDPTDGTLTAHRTDGTLVGDLDDMPLDLSEFPVVYDGTSSECWIWDAKSIGGSPVAVFAVFPGHATTAHEYWQARWIGGEWVTEKICDAGTSEVADYLYSGEPNYSGGIAQDPNNVNRVFVSREFGASDFRIHAVEKIAEEWTVTDWLSEHLTYQKNARPRTVSARGQTHVLWWGGGNYANYSTYDVNVFLHPDVFTPVPDPPPGGGNPASRVAFGVARPTASSIADLPVFLLS